MRKEVLMYLNQRPDLKEYVRQHPYWYRRLSREPNSVYELENQTKAYFGKTFPQRVERLQNNLQLVMMLMQMLQSNSGLFTGRQQ